MEKKIRTYSLAKQSTVNMASPVLNRNRKVSLVVQKSIPLLPLILELAMAAPDWLLITSSWKENIGRSPSVYGPIRGRVPR